MLCISNKQCDAETTGHQWIPMTALIQLSVKFCPSADRTGKFSSRVRVLRNLRPSSCQLHQLHLDWGNFNSMKAKYRKAFMQNISLLDSKQ